MKKTLYYCSIALAMLMLTCCASAGKNFNYANRTHLVIGKTSIDEAQKLLGEPNSSRTVSKDNGESQILSYAYAYAAPTGTAARALNLEARAGVLNAIVFSSGFAEDSTDFNYEASADIKKGSSSKTDVERIMGEPTGKALCPSLLADFEDKCKFGVEVWAWMHTSKAKGLDTRTMKSKIVKITFNENNIVSNIDRTKEN